MGAWGAGSFENDNAMDWAGEVVDADEGMPDDEDSDLTKEVLIVGPLATIVQTPDDEQIDADVASDAVAAAEVVAALFGKPSKELSAAGAEDPDEEGNTLGQLMAWVTGTSSPIKSHKDIKATAHQAVSRILESELAELWAESEDKGKAWLSALDDLQSRLR